MMLTKSPIAEALLTDVVPESHADVVRDAALTARAAQRTWPGVSLAKRLSILDRLRHLIVERSADLADAIRLPQREPAETYAAEILPLADAARYLVTCAEDILQPRRESRRGRPWWCAGVTVDTCREPWGVVLIVGPSNYPLFLPGVQVLQALAAGNAVLWKPGRDSSDAACLFRELCVTAGCPSDLIQVLPEDVAAVHQALATGVDHVVLTGSTESGRSLLRACAETLTPATVELSGCDAVFVDATADVTAAARAVAFGLTFNGSATCMAPRRVYVHNLVAVTFKAELQRLLEDTPAKPVDPRAAGTARLLIKEALAAGGRMLCGSLASGNDWSPMLLTDVPGDSRLNHADLFVPVSMVFPVNSMSSAIEASEQCPYALSAAVFASPSVATNIARQLRVGCVTINDLIAPTADPRVSFTGWNQSGFGTTRGPEGLRQMTRLKTIVTQHARFRPHLDPARPATVGLIRGLLEFTHGLSWGQRLRGLQRLWRSRGTRTEDHK